MFDQLIREAIEIIRSRWHRRSTLLIAGFFLLVVFLSIFSIINFDELEIWQIWVIVIAMILLTVFWFLSNRVRRAPKGKIGFAVGVVTDDPVQQQKIKRDFIKTLRDLLNKSKFKYSFVFIELPNHLAEKLDTSEAAIDMLHDIRCTFMVFGKARTTLEKGQVQHVLDLEGAVAHRPIPVQISRSLAKEFGDLFPRRKIISSEGDLFEFEITAKWIDLVSKYVIAIAALLSGDVDYAQELFENLHQVLSITKPDLPALIKIKQRLPLRLTDVYLVQLNICYQKWLRNKDGGLLIKMGAYLDKLKILSPEKLEARFVRSIWYFLSSRNIKLAKAEILKARAMKHSTWQYNYAFLLAYEGNTQESMKQYKVAVQEVFEEPKVVLEIIEFIMWVLDNEPDKIQLHFCLGYIYYYALRDYALALESLEKFVEVTPANRFPIQVRDAGKLILQIEKDIRSGKIKLEN